MSRGKHWKSGPSVYRRPATRTCYSVGGTRAPFAVPIVSGQTWEPTLARSEPPPIPYAGVRAGEIIGYRLWWLIEGCLCSLAHRWLWPPEEAIVGNTRTVVADNGLFTIWGGIYAFANPARWDHEISEMQAAIAGWREFQAQWTCGGGNLIMFSSSWEARYETTTFVAGRIKMWGDVVEHDEGYRAEFAKVYALDAIFGEEGDLDSLRAKYGVT